MASRGLKAGGQELLWVQASALSLTAIVNHFPTQCPLLAELNLKLITCPLAKLSASPTAPVVAPAPPPSPDPDLGGCAASTSLASLSGLMGLATAPSSLAAGVAPLKEDGSEYDMDNDISWEGDDLGVDIGDSPHKITMPVAPYLYPSYSHVCLKSSSCSTPLALFSISLSMSIMRLLNKLSLFPTLPSSLCCFAVANSGATDTMLPNKSGFISYKKVSGLNVWMGNNSYIPVLGQGSAIVALNGKPILIRNALQVPGLAVPLYSLRERMTQRSCGFFGSDKTGFLVYFPTFVHLVDTSVWTAICPTNLLAHPHHLIPSITSKHGAFLICTLPRLRRHHLQQLHPCHHLL
jgi:hypothetical protein